MKVDYNNLHNLPFIRICQILNTSREEDVLRVIDEFVKREKNHKPTDSEIVFRHLNSLQQNLSFYAAGRRIGLGSSARIMEKLAEANMSLTVVDTIQQTALFYAARERCAETITALVRMACDVNHKDVHGQTCLWYTVRDLKYNAGDLLYAEKKIPAVELLMKLGVAHRHVDRHGHKVVDLCLPEETELRELLTTGLTPRKRAKRPIKPPSTPIWKYEFTTRTGIEYFIRCANMADSPVLGGLEDEFIEEHQDILTKLFRARPPINSTCKALGLNVNPAVRKTIIASIAASGDRTARTLAAVEKDSDEIHGYLYFKCSHDKKDRSVEISHLKVRNNKKRRGIGKNLFTAVEAYLEANGLGEFASDMRLSVFDANKDAISVYESLGFHQWSDPWFSQMKEWPEKDPLPEICWRRYRRADDSSDDEKMKSDEEETTAYNSNDDHAEESDASWDNGRRKRPRRK